MAQAMHCVMQTENIMAINFNKALGVHDNALLLFEKRTQLLTENIVNADTPNYKARDINFDRILRGQQSNRLALKTSQDRHIATAVNDDGMIEYRVPEQSSADGNTVDVQQEKAAFAENIIRYQTTLNILTRRFSGMKNAFRGE